MLSAQIGSWELTGFLVGQQVSFCTYNILKRDKTQGKVQFISRDVLHLFSFLSFFLLNQKDITLGLI